jgi:ABC-type antimicrobial peptide transport system permease subunit
MGIFKRVSILALLLGFIVEEIGSVIGRFILVFVLVKTIPTTVHDAPGLIYSSISYLLIALIIALLCSYLGGFIAAKIAKTAKTKNALIVALFFEFFIYNPLVGESAFPIWYLHVLLNENI